MNNMNSDAVVKNYEEHGALLRGHFLLSSGLHSDAYLQSELIMQDPANAKKVISGLVDVLKDLDFTTIVSPAIGGIRFGYELASQMNKRTLFTERVDGVMTFRRGFTLQKDEKVLVAEDVVTTGKSTKECMKAVEDAGEVNDLALSGNETAQTIMNQAKEYLANHIAAVYAFLDPEIVILGGSVALKINGFVEDVEQRVKEKVYSVVSPYVNIVKTDLDEDSGLLGAACLGFQIQK